MPRPGCQSDAAQLAPRCDEPCGAREQDDEQRRCADRKDEIPENEEEDDGGETDPEREQQIVESQAPETKGAADAHADSAESGGQNQIRQQDGRGARQ